ncbi:unnamed protein product [Rotaria magnacalcarata]|uniref:Meiosis regulator and mRNA stability factor 1 n=1 Tax=Rotaria magnacalcarata TaxID=392030 RepID=A0A819UMT4_9BILA|nr:unnamed protein product [Rotaria magnacalcarata]
MMCLLKKYYRRKWEEQYGKSNPWFISFIGQYQNGENHDIYERVLTHAAEYGDNNTENCRILSIVLQFLFETVDDECWIKTKLFADQYLKEQPTSDSQYLRETENSNDRFLKETNICDSLWYAITNEGLKSITKYSDYIIPFVMHEQLNKSQSVLFEALREYYRTQLFSLLKENRIPHRQQLYDLVLDNVAEHGWLTGIQVIQQKVAPKCYKNLLENLNSLLQKRKAQANQALEQQEGNKERNAPGENKKSDKQEQEKSIEQPEQNKKEEGQAGNKNPDKTLKNKSARKKEKSKKQKAQSQSEDPNEQDKIKIVEKEGANKESNRGEEEEDKEQKQQEASNLQGINTCSENKHTEANLTEAAVAHNQERDEEGKPNKITSEVKPDDTISETPHEKNKIFISGLPKNMPEQVLFDTLWDVFSTVGNIKINRRTDKPWINLLRQKDNKCQLSGNACITFEEEESVIEAIKKYHQQCIPVFNGARIYVSEARIKNVRAESAQPRQRSPEQPQAIDSNKIFIGGLPTNMPEQVLFDKLTNVFLTVGKIKINRRTGKPWINLLRQKDNRCQLSGNAGITFEEEESVIKAIKKYNQQSIPAFNDARIYVQKHKARNEGTIWPVTSMPPKSLSPVRAGPDQPDGPVNIFWDIENVAIPAKHSAFKIALKLQKILITDRQRAKGTFMTYCDTNTISKEQHKGLSMAGVKIQHVPNYKTSVVDHHILMALQEFGVQQKEPCTMVLISGDSDFTLLLNKLRFQYKHYVIAIHNQQAKSELLQTANEAHPWGKFTENCCEMTEIILQKKPNAPMHASSGIHRSTLQNQLNPSETAEVVKSPNLKKRDRPKKQCRGVQPPGPLLSSAGDLSKNGDLFCCLECDKKFPTNVALVQHRQAKHKIGELIQLSSSTSINDLDGQRQLSAGGGQPESDLIAFDDGDGYGLSQASSLSATKETISLIDLEEDSKNTDGGEWENLSASEMDDDDDDDVDDINDSEDDGEDVGGIVQNDWEPLRALFEQNFQNNADLGASLAVYHRGKLVVNLWGGWFDKQKAKPYDNDTLQLVFSTSKGLVAMAIALYVQRGLLNYTDKVIKYWPEYGQSDKENTTVADIMSHRAGLPALRNSNLSIHEYLDWYSVIHKLEKQKPYWVPRVRSMVITHILMDG